jgi:sulfatase modifying factor 1
VSRFHHERGYTAMTTILKYARKVWTLVFSGCVLISLFPCHVSALEKHISNSLDMTFVLIPGGTFTMGSPADEQGRRSDEAAHEVTIGRPFYMQTTEVTVKQWRAVMGTRLFFKKRGADNMPVVDVSWDDCMEFLKKLNALNDGVYRLPTEAEWEYACRGGNASIYGWGDTIDCTKAMYANNTLKTADCVKSVQSKGLPADEPAPVGSYASNAWGLYDMPGNVWEWCQGWYGPYQKGTVVDPQGPRSGSEKVRRGGSWYGPWQRCRCANRNFSHPASRYQTTGFRLVREAG